MGDPREHQQGDGDRYEVDAERPPPRGVVHEHAAEHGSDHERDRGGARPRADRLCLGGAAEGGHDEREARGYKQRSREALREAGANEHAARGRERDHERRDAEPDEANPNDADAAVSIA